MISIRGVRPDGSSGIRTNPEEAFARGFEAFGQRLHRIILTIRVSLLRAKHRKGTQLSTQGEGQDHHVYYVRRFRDPELEQRQYVRYDPFDAALRMLSVGIDGSNVIPNTTWRCMVDPNGNHARDRKLPSAITCTRRRSSI